MSFYVHADRPRDEAVLENIFQYEHSKL